jgi:hypothetical protein
MMALGLLLAALQAAQADPAGALEFSTVFTGSSRAVDV